MAGKLTSAKGRAWDDRFMFRSCLGVTKCCPCRRKSHSNITICSVCDKKWPCKITKCCFCHEKWHCNITKCAHHEKSHSNITKCCPSLPRKETFQHHHMLRLPQKMMLQHHQTLRLPLKVTTLGSRSNRRPLYMTLHPFFHKFSSYFAMSFWSQAQYLVTLEWVLLLRPMRIVLKS